MRKLLLILLLSLISFAQEEFKPSLHFGIEGGMDHYNSMSTDAVFRVYSQWNPTPKYTFLGTVEAASSFNVLLISHWQVVQPVGFDASYIVRNFSSLEVLEHNLHGGIILQHKKRAVGIRARGGWNFRFTDLDTQLKIICFGHQ